MSDPDPHNPKQLLELEKLKLEIKALKRKSIVLDTVLQLLPLVSVLLALTGFMYGIIQSGKGEEKARLAEQTNQRIKIQEQIRSDLDQIVKFPTDKTQTAAQVSFLLTDLDRLMRTTVGGVAVVSNDERKRSSEIFARLVSDSLDLGERRNIGFSESLLISWQDYGAYLQTNSRLLNNILVNHCDALEGLSGKAPRYFALVKYTDQTRDEVKEPPNLAIPVAADFRHFEELVSSYSRYLQLIQDPNQREFAIKLFQGATCNRELTQQEFGQSFDPNKDPAFSTCIRRHSL